MNLPLEEINQAVGGVLQGPAALSARGYSIDSRSLTAGDLFFAIRGPRFDGHEFVRDAVTKKAVGAIVDRDLKLDSAQFGVIQVQSTASALSTLATYVRRK